MTKNPELYNSNAYNYDEKTTTPATQILPIRELFLDSIAQQYYETCNESRTITFDSGEHSLRRKYVEKALVYLLQIKGIPSVAISTLNSRYTKYYLSKVPLLLRSKVLDLGIFQIYNQCVDLVRNLMDLLYIDIRHKTTLDYFIFSLKSLQSKVIKKLNSMGILVILDRSLISTFIYNNSLLKTAPEEGRSLNTILQIQTLRRFKPYAAFFVHSLNTPIVSEKENPTMSKSASYYDSFDSLNLHILGILPKIKETLPFLVELPSHNTFEDNMNQVKTKLREL